MTIDIGAVDDFPDRTVRVVRAGGHELGVVRLDGNVFALENRCPHQAGPLCEGRLRPLVVAAAIGSPDLDERSLVIECPWHRWEFDVRTGRAPWDERYHCRTWPARIHDGRVVVEI